MSDQVQDIEISNCEKEQIRIPGSIQPHGALLVIKEGVIIGASANTDALLGMNAKELQGKKIADFVNVTIVDRVSPVELVWNTGKDLKIFNGMAHQNKDGLTILELESTGQNTPKPLNFYDIFSAAVTTIQKSPDIGALTENIVKMIRSITGFDHVMLYQFDQDCHGHVLAEDKISSRPVYLNHHFPASDIPSQARELYLVNWARFIPDVDYQPCALELKDKKEPLDLSFSILRSVSPVHIQYLRNMDVSASMSISIIKDGKLWGLIVCHHTKALFLPYNYRNACMLLGHFFSLELSSKEQQSQSTARLKLRKLMTAILERITFEDDIPKGLLKDSGLLMDLMGSQGAVLCFDGRMTLLGKTPDKEKVIALIEWMDKYNRKKAFASDCLMGLYPPAQEFKDTASGIIAVPIPKAANDYIIWFRPEHVHDLTWAGNPHEPVVAGNERSKFNPRNSFESWKEILKFKSLPWEPVQIEAAHEIYDMISGLILKKHLLTQIRAGKEMDKL